METTERQHVLLFFIKMLKRGNGVTAETKYLNTSSNLFLKLSATFQTTSEVFDDRRKTGRKLI